MKQRSTFILISLMLTTYLFGQDKYSGEFLQNEFYIKTDTNIPIGSHIGIDADEDITILINYGERASIENITVKKSGTTICYEEVNFPNEAIEWNEISKGLWINSINKKERYKESFDGSFKVKLHYAGFLENGEPFDNSFIRNLPLIGNLEWFILGFSIGSINIQPNTVRIIKISPELAYGSEGGGNIPPNSTIYYIIYKMEDPKV